MSDPQAKHSALITGGATVLAAVITVIGALLLQPKTPVNETVNSQNGKAEAHRTPSPAGNAESAVRELAVEIPVMIRLLRARNYQEFEERYISPEEKAVLKDRGKSGNLDDEHAAKMINVLEYVRDKKPDFVSQRQDEVVAEFFFDIYRYPELKIGADDFLRFRKAYGQWYLVIDPPFDRASPE
jgi:hypothetical protein